MLVDPIWNTLRDNCFVIVRQCFALDAERQGQLKGGAKQFRPRVFEKCTALRHLKQRRMTPPTRKRCLPECCFLEAGIVSQDSIQADAQRFGTVSSISPYAPLWTMLTVKQFDCPLQPQWI